MLEGVGRLKTARSSEAENGHATPSEMEFPKYSEAQARPDSGGAVSRPYSLDGNFARRSLPPAVGERVFADRNLPGFGLRVRKSGGVGTWFVIVRRRGRRTRLTLGRADKISAPDARAAARKALAEAALDGLPRREPKREAMTFAAFAAEFMRDHATRWKSSTRRSSEGVLRRELLPVLGKLDVGEIARTDISRWRDSFAGGRQATFNRAVPVLSVMLQQAELLGYRKAGSNPCRGIARYKRKPKERFLSPAEYRRLGRALDLAEQEDPLRVAVIRLLIFTGARLGEILTLRWPWVQKDRLALPDSKTGPKIIYLNGPARAVIARVPRVAGEPLVFQSQYGFEPVKIWHFWNELRASCDLDDVRLHDLRHSFASVAISNGVPLLTIGRLLGHELPETTARYAHLADDFVADAAVRVSGSLARCLGGGE